MNRYAFQLGDVPLLLVSERAPTQAAATGTVILLHGSGAKKESNQGELERFAKAGFLAVGIDVLGHGERRAVERSNDERAFIGLVVEAARELPGFIQALKLAALAHDGGVGVFGISMGGFIGYAAAPSRAIDALAATIASPSWRVDVPEEPVRHAAGFFPCALLSQVAGRDTMVSAAEARQFHAQLAPSYASAPDRLRFIEYPESAHFMRGEDWDAVMNAAIDWFGRFLRPRD